MANTLSGATKINGVPVPAKVAVVRVTDNVIVATTVSNASTGLWSVSGLAAGRYEAVIFKSGFRAAVEGPFDLDGTSPVGTFAEEILLDSPSWFCRHNESSGTVANNEVGADGTYSGTPVFGAAAIYTGGLTCWDLNNASHCDIPASVMPSSTTAFTLEILIKRKATITGLQAMIDRDSEGTGQRYWQWRWESGDDLNAIKIIGSVQTFMANDIGPANGVGLFALVVEATGTNNAKIYKNGALIAQSTWVASTNYGSSIGMRIGRRLQGDSQANYYCAESMVYTHALPAGNLLRHAQAAALA